MDSTVYVNLGTLGFCAEASYSGNDYAKWVSHDGRLVIGSLPDDDFPDLSQRGAHRFGGRRWVPMTLGQFAQLPS